MPVLSIDFGTSYCAAAYLDAAAHPTPICFGVNQYNGDIYKFPTVIQYASDDIGNENKIVGDIALSNLIQSNRQDSSIVSKIKTELRERTGYFVNGHPKKTLDIVADIFSKIKDIAECQTNLNFDTVILCHPAQYEVSNKHLLADAAKKCGFTNVLLIEEPVAASYAFVKKYNISTEQGALIFDYGGGTVDIAYLWYDENSDFCFKFPPYGKSECGGEYLDLLIHNYIHDKIGDKNNDRIIPILLEHCAKMKIAFSKSEIETIAYNGKAITISRKDFEKIISPKTDIATDLLKKIVQKCNDKNFPIDYVFLNGGSSRLHIINTTINSLLPTAIKKEYGGDDLAVAIGGIIYYANKFNIESKEHNSRVIAASELDEILIQYRNQFKKEKHEYIDGWTQSSW